MLVHHIGYYVTDIQKSKKAFLCLGYNIEKDVTVDTIRGIKVMFLASINNRIELIQILNEVQDNDINFMKNTKYACPYHICYEVDDIDDSIQQLSKQKFKIINKKSKAIAIDNKEVVFLYNKHVGIIELIER